MAEAVRYIEDLRTPSYLPSVIEQTVSSMLDGKVQIGWAELEGFGLCYEDDTHNITATATSTFTTTTAITFTSTSTTTINISSFF